MRGKRNEPANVLHTLAVLADLRGVEPAELERRIDLNADSRLRPRLAVSVAPKKSLGQHFLVDDNILGVIARLAELRHDDVALEIGPGLGVLTRLLAERCGHVHAVELDRRLEPHLAELGARENVSLHWGDALRLDLARLEPVPTKLVANLPYNVATPIVAESLAGLPSVGLWCVMVQREVADRFFAVPSTKAYGGVSVLVQLAARRTGAPPGFAYGLPAASERRLGDRRLQPHSAAGALRGRPARRGRGVCAPAQDARQLAAARGCCDARGRGRRPRLARARRGRAGGGASAGAVRRVDAGARMRFAFAPAKINLALVVGPLRDDGKHEVATVPAARRARGSDRDRARRTPPRRRL